MPRHAAALRQYVSVSRQSRVSAAIVAVTSLALLAAGASVATASTSKGSARLLGAGRPATMCPAPRHGAQYEGPSVRDGRRTIALTFDDGPGRSTKQIISILARYHVRATFFNLGTGEGQWPDLVRQEARMGFLLGDHTVNHTDLALLTPAAQASQIYGAADQQRVLVQSSPCVFRPPYGAYNQATTQLANQRRMALWMWNNSGADWMARGSGSDYWVQRITSLAEGVGATQQHAVVLLHNQQISMPATVRALPRIIEFFQRRGYAFVDLLGRTGAPGTCATTPATVPRIPMTLLSGAVLGTGASISSPGHQFELKMLADGDLVVRLATGRVLWASRTAGNPGATLRVESDGKVAVRAADDRVLWSAGTIGHPGARVAMRADGSFAVVEGASALWTSRSTLSALQLGERLRASWRLTSPNGLCRLIQQRSGPLTLLAGDGQVLWSTATARAPGAMTVLLRGGDLGVYDAALRARWVSATNGYRRATARVTDAGTLEIRSGSTRVWTTP